MNEDLRKKNKRNNLIILVVGIVIIIGIIAGFSIHNHRVATQMQLKNLHVLTLILM